MVPVHPVHPVHIVQQPPVPVVHAPPEPEPEPGMLLCYLSIFYFLEEEEYVL